MIRRPALGSFLLSAAPLALACLTSGCDDAPASDDAESTSSPVRDERTRTPGIARVETPGGPAELGYELIDGLAITEGDVVLPPEVIDTDAAALIGRRWPSALVPYVIEPDLPDAERVTTAIAHWKERTNVRFLARTTQSDYVSFHPSTGCSSNIGRTGGRQAINLTTGEGAWNVAGIGIEPSTDSVYYFYKRGFATAGTTARADAKRSHFRYVLPPGKTPSNIVEVGFTTGGHLVAWYSDGTVSEGTVTDFARYAAPVPYTLATGKLPADVLALAIDGRGAAHAFYRDGTHSVGTTTRLAATGSAQAFTVASGESITSLAHVDVAASGAFKAFYSDGQTSSGTATSLGTTLLGKVSYPGHCSTGSTIHEIGHAVGYFHEQTRADRDQYVTINFANISSGASHNFQKYWSGNDLGAYDFGSIMHYDSYAFSANGKPTIVKRADGTTFIGQRSALSPGDIAAARLMYPGPPVTP